MPDVQPDRETLWKQYALHVDLYKFYCDAVVKITVFYYAITGAIISFYFTRTEVGLAKWGLVLPSALSVGLAVLFVYGTRLLVITRNDVFAIRNQLGLKVAADFGVFGLLLYLFAGILFLTGASLAVLIIVR
jgi:phage tail protein X